MAINGNLFKRITRPASVTITPEQMAVIASQVPPTDISGKVDKVTGKGLSTNDLTNTLKTNYDAAVTHAGSSHAPANATVGADWNTNVSNKPTIPAALSALTDDSTHRLVTDTEKSTWNGKESGGAVAFAGA